MSNLDLSNCERKPNFSRCVGQFVLSARKIRENPLDFYELFKGLVVLQAEYKVYNDAVQYVALCYSFDEVEQGSIPPTYVWDSESSAWTK